MSELGPDELYLKGRLQVATAHDALSATGINPEAAKSLAALLRAHVLLTKNKALEDQGNLVIYLQGEKVVRMKEDIIFSLNFVELSADTQPDTVAAARGLLELLIQK